MKISHVSQRRVRNRQTHNRYVPPSTFTSDPLYDDQKGLKSIIESARNDLRSLIKGGVDAVMFSNEFVYPT